MTECAIFADVEQRRARDLAAILRTHAEFEVQRAREECEEAISNAEQAAEILRDARAGLNMWVDMLEDAIRLCGEADG